MGNTTPGASEFASLFSREAETLAENFVVEESRVRLTLDRAGLTPAQRSEVTEAIRIAVTDTLYTVLLALDGEASIGGTQQQYRVLDESGEEIYQPGELEAAAWKYFHSEQSLGNDDGDSSDRDA